MNRLNTAKQFLGAFAVAGFLVASAAQGAVVNGTFDTPVPSNATGGGWTSSNIDGSGGWKTTGGHPSPFFILNEAGNPGTDPTILQLLTGLTAGATYQASGDYQNTLNVQSTGAVAAFGAAIDGIYLFEAQGTGNPNWLSFSFNFVAAASSATLSFAAERNGTDVDFGIDNIAVMGVAVIPEPSTYALMLAGLGFVGFVAHRRRKALAA